MATVRELSDPYANFLLNPLPPQTADVCRICLTLTQGYPACYACDFQPDHADAVLPISYSVDGQQLHTALAGYKRRADQTGRKFRAELAAVLWRFLDMHEACLARRAGSHRFDLVTTVPSSVAARDPSHPLRGIVGSVVGPTAPRYAALLARSTMPVAERTVEPGKYAPSVTLSGESVLLVDDTWTTGGSAQSAAGALKLAGAGAIGVIVIERHIHEGYKDNKVRLRAMPRPFEWTRCALER